MITPSQLLFLKLLDGYLQSSTAQRSDISEEAVIPDISYLIPYLGSVTIFAASSLKQVLDSKEHNATTTEEDPILPRTLEGSILLCQCLIASALREIPLDHERELLARQIAGFSTPAGSILSALRQVESRSIETLTGKSMTMMQVLSTHVNKCSLMQRFSVHWRLCYLDRNRLDPKQSKNQVTACKHSQP